MPSTPAWAPCTVSTMARAVAVPGAVAVIAVAAGGALWGILGALIAIPTAAAGLLLVREVFVPRQDAR